MAKVKLSHKRSRKWKETITGNGNSSPNNLLNKCRIKTTLTEGLSCFHLQRILLPFACTDFGFLGKRPIKEGSQSVYLR